MFVTGNGPPLVLVPGVNGRWEWLQPTVEALARHFRVATFSLCGEPGGPPMCDRFDAHLTQVSDACAALASDRAIIAGVSFGGWVAARYAADRPERTAALVLVSAPGPGYELSSHHARWVARPLWSYPAFLATAPLRVSPELRRSFPAWRDRLRFTVEHGWRVVRAPMSASRAARRVQLALAEDFGAAAARVRTPTLLLTGEDDLDSVVPPASTRQYLRYIAGARVAKLPDSGHLGPVTRARELAEHVRAFAETVVQERDAGAA